MPTRPFQFALAPVLQIRERAVDAAREALGRAVDARAAGESAVRRAEARLAEGLVGGDTGRTVHQLGSAAAHRDGLARAVAEARQAAERLRAAEARARRALGDAIRQHEALDGLRQEAARDHRLHALRVETAALDDLATAGRATSALSPS
jgi:flagellar export protein FliJ